MYNDGPSPLKVGAVGLVVLGVFTLVVSTLFVDYKVKTPSDMVAIQTGSGFLDSTSPKRLIPAGTNKTTVTNDDYVLFPNNTRDYDATGQKGSDSGPLQGVSKDSVEMNVPVVFTASLKTDYGTLKEFYLRFAKRDGIKFSDDGSFEGDWMLRLRRMLRDPADAAIDRILQQYTWREIWNDPATKTKIEAELAQEMPLLMKQTHGKVFFEDMTLLVKKPVPADSKLRTNVAQEASDVAQSNSARARAEADAAKARAEVAVAQAEAAKKRAEVQGYGGTDAYLRKLAIEEGLNPWQPTYVVPGTAPR